MLPRSRFQRVDNSVTTAAPDDDSIDSVMSEITSRSGRTNGYSDTDSTLDMLMSGYDEEAANHEQAMERGELKSYNATSIEKMMEANIKLLKKKYPMGGLKASLFITSEVLLAAPENYFDKYDEVVRDAVVFAQSSIADKELSSVIGESQAHPLDEALKEAAYKLVVVELLDFMDRNSSFRELDRVVVVNLAMAEIIGFGKLDPLWRDRKIDEIICNGPKDIQIERHGQLTRVPSCKFRDASHLSDMIQRLFEAIGKRMSRTTPLVKGRLHDKSRMFAVDQSVAQDGPNFNIRRHKPDYITARQIINWGSANEEMLTDLGNWIHKGCSWLVIGGTGTGKTSLMNALSGFVRDDARVVTLEDNLEMKLHPEKLIAAPMETQDARPDQPGSGVSMRDLVKGSMQMRPDGIIIGEVTDGAAYDLAQALSTGHWGASTLHANDEYDGIYRIMSLIAQGGVIGPSAALPMIASAFDLIVHVERFPEDGSRRIIAISEIDPYPTSTATGEVGLKTNKIWQFVSTGLVDGKVTGHWEKVGDIGPVRRQRLHLDLEKDKSWAELDEISFYQEPTRSDD